VHRLIASWREIDHGQASVANGEVGIWILPMTIGVRATAFKTMSHSLNRLTIAFPTTKRASDTTH
jgi:hypothetical protein